MMMTMKTYPKRFHAILLMIVCLLALTSGFAFAFPADIGLFVAGKAQWGINASGVSQRGGSSTPYYQEVYDQTNYSLLARQTEGTWSEGIFPETMKASSNAKAYFGLLGVKSSAWTNGAPELSSRSLVHLLDSVGVWRYDAYSEATASFHDSWMIDAGALNGTTGTLTVGIDLDGTRQGAFYNHASFLSLNMTNYGLGSASNNDIYAGHYELTIPFRFGVSNHIQMTLSSAAGSGTQVFYHSDYWDEEETGHQVSRGQGQVVDFYNTARIDALTFYDAAGAPITGAVFTAGSNHDYLNSAQPVPVPGTLLLLSTSLMVICAIGRRRYSGLDA